MTKAIPVLGHAIEGGAPILINVDDVVGSDICIVANKGAGKSGMVRVLCEQTRGIIRQIILDPEGEFHTLREAGDYLIAGGDEADCPATLANARLLATRLMENPGISVVIQIDHLKPWEQEEFVGLFLESMMDAPKALWHPILLVIDETQRFAPQDSNVSSSAAMRDIIGRGRKRGITPVFATYRVAAIDKNVTAGSPTWFMGRVGQEIDRKSAALALGFSPSSAEAKEISFLPKRRFWTYGSATTPRPVLFDVADAQTTMTKAGQAMAPVPPAPKSLQKLVDALSKAAAPATPAEPLPAAGAPLGVDLEAIRLEANRSGFHEGVEVGLAGGERQVLDRLSEWIEEQRADLSDINVGVDDRDALVRLERVVAEPDPDFVHMPGSSAAVIPAAEVKARIRNPRPHRPDGEMSEGAFIMTDALQRVLDVLRWWSDRGKPAVTRQRACVMAGYSPKASTFGVYIGKLMKADLVEIPSPGHLQITAAGYALANKTSPALSLTDAARALVSGKAQEIFDILVEVGPSGISRHVLADRLLLSRTASTLGVYIGRISTLGFVEIPRPGEIALADWLRA